MINILNKRYIYKSICSFSTYIQDTIYAVSTGTVTKSALAIIRISGPRTLDCLSLLTNSSSQNIKKLKSKYTYLKYIYKPKTKIKIDQSIILWLPKPSTYTGEDMCELHIHGSKAVINDTLDAIELCNNNINNNKKNNDQIRLAEPGEFTRRAFLNSKLDLIKVEGLNDLLNAETSHQRGYALKQYDGTLTNQYIEWKNILKECVAYYEAIIDFGDDENDVNENIILNELILPKVQKLLNEMKYYINFSNKGEEIRKGINLCIIGSPNVGKSSLINILARRPVSIVTPMAGTTRDIIEIKLDLGGYAVNILDTAGIHENHENIIEKEGIKKAKNAIDESDIVLVLYDLTDLKNTLNPFLNIDKPVIYVGNKLDLIKNINKNKIISNNKYKIDSLNISCKNELNINQLLNKLTKYLNKRYEDIYQNNHSPIITRKRHRQHLKNCIEYLNHFLSNDLSMELAAEELKSSMNEISRITGVIDTEEILDIIFRDFCIGK